MILITTIEPQNYLLDYKDDLEQKKQDGAYSHNTVRAKTYAVDEFVHYFEYHEHVIDLDDFYGSVDIVKSFFEQTPITKNKVSAVRDFLAFICRDLPTEDGDRLDDVRGRIKRSKLQGQVSRWDKGRKTEIQGKILTDDELAAVYAAAKPYEALMVKMMLDTGCRPGELAALSFEDVNYDVKENGIGATIKIDKTYSSDIGVQDHPKSEDSIRTVNLQPRTAGMLKEWVEAFDIPKGQLLFKSYRNVYNMFKDLMTHVCIRIGEDGITTLGPHALRHNTCTRLINDLDYPKEKVQQYMGHSSVQITEGYQHFDEDRVLDLCME